MGRLLGNATEPVIEVTLSELEALTKAAESDVPASQMSAMLGRLTLERAPARLRRIGDQARSLAQRLGRSSLRVDVTSQGDVRFDRQRWASFWAAFIHPVRNALDHGIESEAERVAAGKPPAGRVTIGVRRAAQTIIVELTDDGRGIDFDKVRAKARARGLPFGTEAELIEALFSEGLSTTDHATELSGRGLGMSALREAARSLNGVISLESKRGQGTTLRVQFPLLGAS